MTKILLVEDDKSLREIYGVRLQAEGYDIVSASNGEEALALAIKERPDLIISDVMMPKISGFDMLDILRSTTETKDIRVIMMTALGSEDQRERGEALGANRYLVKSQVGIEDVVRTVHEVLGDLPGANTTNATPHPVGQTTTPLPSAQPVPQAPVPQPQAQPQASAEAPQATPPPLSPAQPVAMPTPFQPVPSTVPQAQPQQNIASDNNVDNTSAQSTPENTAPPQAAPAPQATSLPQPTAPFSTPRPANLGDRIIHPLTGVETGPSADLNDRIAEELSGQTAQPQTPNMNPLPPQPAPPTDPQPFRIDQPQADPIPTTPPPVAQVVQPEQPAPVVLPQQESGAMQPQQSQQPQALPEQQPTQQIADPQLQDSGLEFEETPRPKQQNQ